jgi:hypothetical protein
MKQFDCIGLKDCLQPAKKILQYCTSIPMTLVRCVDQSISTHRNVLETFLSTWTLVYYFLSGRNSAELNRSWKYGRNEIASWPPTWARKIHCSYLPIQSI